VRAASIHRYFGSSPWPQSRAVENIGRSRIRLQEWAGRFIRTRDGRSARPTKASS
jgi:hypothetical protein